MFKPGVYLLSLAKSKVIESSEAWSTYYWSILKVKVWRKKKRTISFASNDSTRTLTLTRKPLHKISEFQLHILTENIIEEQIQEQSRSIPDVYQYLKRLDISKHVSCKPLIQKESIP